MSVSATSGWGLFNGLKGFGDASVSAGVWIAVMALANGFRMLAIPYDSPGILSLYLVVRTGSRDEVEPGHSGFAHFFEHMMFRGTKRFSAEAYNETLKRIGVDASGSTSDDWTMYYMTGPSTGLDTMVELEADRFKNLSYTEGAFRTEALAVAGKAQVRENIVAQLIRNTIDGDGHVGFRGRCCGESTGLPGYWPARPRSRRRDPSARWR